MRGSHIIAQHSIFKLLVFHRYSSSRGLSSQLIIDEKFLHRMRLIYAAYVNTFHFFFLIERERENGNLDGK